MTALPAIVGGVGLGEDLLKSNQDRSILFKERSGAESAARTRTFENWWI